jgi:hypothetical protein
LFKSIFSFIQDKQREADERYTQRRLDAWFNANHIFTEEATHETECIFETLTIGEPIKIVCDYNMSPFDSSKYNTDPARIIKLREYFSQEFGIAIYTEKTNQKLGYLPLLTNIEPELYREGSYMQAIHNLLRNNVKVYAKLVRIEQNDNPIRPLNASPNYHHPKSIFVVEFHINTDLEKLNKSVKERLDYLEEQRMEREKEATKLKFAPNNPPEYDKDDYYLSSDSVWDEYDEDGIPYEDYERDQIFDDLLEDNLDDFKKEKSKVESFGELSSDSVWDEYDEDGIPYEDIKKNSN